jgi:hypothetical protein
MSGTKKPNLDALAIPTLHMNGSGLKDLMDPLETAYTAATTLVEALAKMGPNARDYYVQANPNEAFEQARREHSNRIQAVVTIMRELEHIADALFRQDATRTRQKQGTPQYPNAPGF